MQFRFAVRRAVLALAALAIVSANTAGRAAAEELRWKLSAGDVINYHQTQDMSMNVQAAANAESSPMGQQAMDVQRVVSMSWNVKGVDAAGIAEIEQKFHRIQLNMAVSGSEPSAYDTDSDEPAVGMAAMFAPAMEAMTAGSFRFKLSPLGEVSDVEFSEELKQVIANGPGGEAGAAEHFKSMVSQVALVLPERSLEAGDTWKTVNTASNPAGGVQTIETTYTYDGTREADGATLAVIKPSLNMEMGDNPMAEMKTKQQKTDGEVLFDVGAGRLHSISINLNIGFDMVAQEQTMPGTIVQKIDVAVSSGAANAVTARPAEPVAESR
jgi:hypothetical protein